jgi:NAD(P)-dependent dehydrogenase (short-subunit alcohol dehydrogenase family)
MWPLDTYRAEDGSCHAGIDRVSAQGWTALGQCRRAGRISGVILGVSSMTVLDLFQLHGKVAVVTGASSGLGAAAAQALAEAGASVALGARRADRLAGTRKLVEDAGRRALMVQTDVRRPEDCRRLIDQTVAEFGRVDVLVNNAGVGSAVPASIETPEEFRAVLETNLEGCFWMAQAAARVMRAGSSIINVSSVLGIVTAGLPQAAYAASKAGLLGLTRDLAAQWTSRKGIRVNAVAPGFFASEMTEAYPPGYIDRYLSVIPAKRQGEAAEVAAVIVFLASDASSYVTGVTLPVDGGLSIA